MNCPRCTRPMFSNGTYSKCGCGYEQGFFRTVMPMTPINPNPMRVQVQNVYRVDNNTLTAMTRVKTTPRHNEYRLTGDTSHGMVVLGRCKKGMEFEITFTRGSSPFHKRVKIADDPFVRFEDL